MIWLGAVAFAFSVLGTGVIRRCLARTRLLDVPNERSLHIRPTPRGGGIAIVCSVIVPVLGFYVIASDAPWFPLSTVMLGGLLVAAVSFLDDLWRIPPVLRLLVHTGIALTVLLFVGRWHEIYVPGFGLWNVGWLGFPLTVFWLIAVINAYNFMDGIDGIAAGQAVVSGMSWMALGGVAGAPDVVVTATVVTTGSFGFLLHNWSPARIFMGDVGSAFLGYMFAVLPIVAAAYDPRLSAAGILVLWPFLFDTGFTLLRRLARHENVLRAHRSHLYQRLVLAGLSHAMVATSYLVMTLIGGIAAVSVLIDGFVGQMLCVVGIPTVAFLLWRLVLSVEGSAARASAGNVSLM